MSGSEAERVWRRFCDRFEIEQRCVPLFQVDLAGIVAHRTIGRAGTTRPVLRRSRQMEALVIGETDKLVEDWSSGRRRYDGLIYAMGWKTDVFVPLYIGKAETLGRGDANLSANLRNLRTDCSKFARWGDNHAYHIGDLSACVLPGHPPAKRTGKYDAWARALFASAPAPEPRLREPVYFWARAWNASHVGIWEDLGPTPLAFLEYLMIGVASFVSPHLLNREGIARRAWEVKEPG